MSGLLAKTVHQSPVVPSQRPGSATGSRPSKSHSYMVVTMGAVASLSGTCRSRGIGLESSGTLDGGGRGGGRSLSVDGPGRRVRDVGQGELAHPAGELEQDAV